MLCVSIHECVTKGIPDMRTTVGHATLDLTMPPATAPVSTSASTAHARGRATPASAAREPLSPFARMQRRVAGKAGALAGSFNILVGTALADRRRTVRGHRQRVVGMLQFNCEVDRQTANAFVERWLSKPLTPVR